MQGWIKLHRSIEGNEFYFSQRFTKAQAWIDLLLLATHKSVMYLIRGIEIHLQPGQLCHAQHTLAKRWKWNVKTVKQFFNMLQKREMLEYKTYYKIGIITIINWEKYQGSSGEMENKTEYKTEEKTEIYNNDKNDKNVVNSLVEYLRKNNIPVNEETLKMRVQKALGEYGENQFRGAVNDAVTSWKNNGKEGDFVKYLFAVLNNNYQKV